MKKINRVLTIAFAVGLCGVLTSSATASPTLDLPGESCNQVSFADEALFCKKANAHGGNDWCIFCNCANL